jgi:hypothetical protein
MAASYRRNDMKNSIQHVANVPAAQWDKVYGTPASGQFFQRQPLFLYFRPFQIPGKSLS